MSGLLLQLRASAAFTSEIILPDDAGFSLLWEGFSGEVIVGGRGWWIIALEIFVGVFLPVYSNLISDDELVGVVDEGGAGQGNGGLFSDLVGVVGEEGAGQDNGGLFSDVGLYSDNLLGDNGGGGRGREVFGGLVDEGLLLQGNDGRVILGVSEGQVFTGFIGGVVAAVVEEGGGLVGHDVGVVTEVDGWQVFK